MQRHPILTEPRTLQHVRGRNNGFDEKISEAK
jgi:hypothetical protein